VSATALGRTETVSEAFDGYALPGRYLHVPGGGAPVRLLALHGARSDLRRLDPWLPLRERAWAAWPAASRGMAVVRPSAWRIPRWRATWAKPCALPRACRLAPPW